MQNEKERKVWIGTIIWLIVMMDVLLLLLALVFGLYMGYWFSIKIFGMIGFIMTSVFILALGVCLIFDKTYKRLEKRLIK